jgi:hypothetical protein
MRTTLDIDDPVLADLKRLQKLEGKSLGRLASDLLAKALAEARRPAVATRKFRWIRSPMQARVDLADRDALLDAMDEPLR